MTISGSGPRGGSHYQCRFGSVVVEAGAVHAKHAAIVDAKRGAAEIVADADDPLIEALALGRSIRALRRWCVRRRLGSPSRRAHAHRLDLHRAAIAISLNAQQFTTTGRYFAYHHEPVLSSIQPPVGPAAGGSLLALRGAHLDGGDVSEYERLWMSQLEDVRERSTYRCRFSAEDAAEHDSNANATIVPASWDALNALIACRAPPVASIVALDDTDAVPSQARTVAVAITINGRDYTNSTLTFGYVPPPSLDELVPLSGPSLGQTELTSTALASRCGVVFGPAMPLPPACQPHCLVTARVTLAFTLIPTITLALTMVLTPT